MQPKDILDFWFGVDPKFWFAKDEGFDADIKARFSDALADARLGKLVAWEKSLKGMLALVILLDQMSRNLYRNSADAFTHDDEALRLSYRLVNHRDWDHLNAQEKQFAVMPMMHAEDLDAQKDCVYWMAEIGNADNLRFAIIHQEIIEKFGRFPHRNAVLGRDMTTEEQAFLDKGGFAG